MSHQARYSRYQQSALITRCRVEERTQLSRYAALRCVRTVMHPLSGCLGIVDYAKVRNMDDVWMSITGSLNSKLHQLPLIMDRSTVHNKFIDSMNTSTFGGKCRSAAAYLIVLRNNDARGAVAAQSGPSI